MSKRHALVFLQGLGRNALAKTDGGCHSNTYSYREETAVGTGDTIVAISTPLGEGGIGIVRLSGGAAVPIVERLFRGSRGRRCVLADRRVHYGWVMDPDTGERVDEVLVTVMRGPKSYTREDVVEINCHGGLIAVQRLLELAIGCGARLAEPGEFTRRAFLNGRIDLVRAEAVIDIVRAKTERGLRMAMSHLEGGLSGEVGGLRQELVGLLAHIEAGIDFPEDDIEELTMSDIKQKARHVLERIDQLIEYSESGKIYREGICTAIVGKPNVGKSSLLNRLLREKRAIVTEVPGTTRDVIEEVLNIEGVPFIIMDTAGIRETQDAVEIIGVERARESLKKADLVLFVLDGSKALEREDMRIFDDIGDKKTIVLLNKIDLPRMVDGSEVKSLVGTRNVVETSMKEGIGLKELERAMVDVVLGGGIDLAEGHLVANARHRQCLRRAERSIKDSLGAIKDGMPLDLVAIDLRNALESLGEITGESVGEDIVDRIFSGFCVGK